tara:strand:+ start:1848 stop:1976 length:129 start_codon:yes stop_codon:yes gene_type:complete
MKNAKVTFFIAIISVAAMITGCVPKNVQVAHQGDDHVLWEES